MKYFIIVAFIFVLAGCSTTREYPDDRYQPVQSYGTYNYDPFYTPIYDNTYRSGGYYDNSYYSRRRSNRYNAQPRYDRRYDQQPQYRVEPRVQSQPRIIEPRVVQPRDKVYPDGTIKKANGEIIHPNQREKN